MLKLLCQTHISLYVPVSQQKQTHQMLMLRLNRSVKKNVKLLICIHKNSDAANKKPMRRPSICYLSVQCKTRSMRSYLTEESYWSESQSHIISVSELRCRQISNHQNLKQPSTRESSDPANEREHNSFLNTRIDHRESVWFSFEFQETYIDSVWCLKCP